MTIEGDLYFVVGDRGCDGDHVYAVTDDREEANKIFYKRHNDGEIVEIKVLDIQDFYKAFTRDIYSVRSSWSER